MNSYVRFSKADPSCATVGWQVYLSLSWPVVRAPQIGRAATLVDRLAWPSRQLQSSTSRFSGALILRER